MLFGMAWVQIWELDLSKWLDSCWFPFRPTPRSPSLKEKHQFDCSRRLTNLATDAFFSSTGWQVMTAARKTIVAADGGTLWKEVVNAVIPLAGDQDQEASGRDPLRSSRGTFEFHSFQGSFV